MLAGIGGQHPMTRPLSNDLRERVVAAIVGGESCRSVASRFGVAVSSVVKWSQRYRATGSVAPGKVGGHRKRVLEPHRAFVLERIGQTPHLTLPTSIRSSRLSPRSNTGCVPLKSEPSKMPGDTSAAWSTPSTPPNATTTSLTPDTLPSKNETL